jgi:hypothetical protein
MDTGIRSIFLPDPVKAVWVLPNVVGDPSRVLDIHLPVDDYRSQIDLDELERQCGWTWSAITTSQGGRLFIGQ